MATGTTEFIDITTADVFVPEYWHPFVLVARESTTVFAALVHRQFEEMPKFGDLIHVRNLSNLNARSKTANTAITYETNTQTNADITINQHKYAAIAVESLIEVQSDKDQMALHAGKLGFALALDVDDALADNVDGFTGQTVGTLAVANDYDNYVRADQFLNDADAPLEDRFIIISNAEQAGLMKQDRFINSDYELVHGTGGKVTLLEKSYIGSFWQYPLYRSTNVDGTNAAGHDNFFAHKEAIALVMQMQPRIHTMFDIDFFADKIAVEQLYGEASLSHRTDHGVFMAGA